MMKKFLWNGMAALALVLMTASCSDNDFYSASSSRENAEKVFGVDIDPTHDWNMVQNVYADIRVNMGTGETYTYTIYSNDPITESKRIYLKKGTISDGGAFSTNVSCSSDKTQLYVGLTNAKKYTVFKLADIVNGKISVTFGVNGSSARSFTRAIATSNGDVYDKFPSASDVAAYFPTAIPADAKTDAELEAEWKGKNAVDANGNEIIASWGGTIQMWDLYAIYLNMVGTVINNIKVTTPGEYSVGHNWANPADRVYNVYIAVGEGNSLTLKRNGAEHVNFYILSGTITIDSSFGECGGIISVAAGATVNDQRTHIAHNDGVKVFNKGTYNATNTTTYWNGSENTSAFDIGNFCTFYNEGKFTCSSGLTYSPGDANDSYFMNLGDGAELNAPSMTLNSTGNFFNSGKVNIQGETAVTQARLYWVNDGSYTTGSMKFSAKNSTFYNYCQLKVDDTVNFLDGEFNLMDGSYVEIKQGLFNNFIVNMHNNSSIFIKEGSKWGRQGDGTYQGFRTTNDTDVAYVKIGGTSYIPVQQEGALRFSGAKLTFACQEMKFYENYDDINLSSNYSDINYSGETNQGLLFIKQDPRITYNPGNAQIATYAELDIVAPQEGACSATPEENGEDDPEESSQVYTYAFEDTYMGDYDMNDCVLQVWEDDEYVHVKLCCTGAAADLKVYLDDQELFGGLEVHAALGGTKGKFINTGVVSTNSGSKEDSKFEIQDAVVEDLLKSNLSQDFNIAAADFWIKGPSGEIHVGDRTHNAAAWNSSFQPKWEQGNAPYAVVIPGEWAWPMEWTPVIDAYEEFRGFAADKDTNITWYKNPTPGATYTQPNN